MKGDAADRRNREQMARELIKDLTHEEKLRLLEMLRWMR